MIRKFSALFLIFTLSAVCFIAPAYAEPAVGEKAPNFTLTDVNGKTRSLSDFAGKYVVLEWTNHECPFVVKHYGSGNMQKLQADFTAKNVVWLTINSSAPGKQGHYAPEKWREVLAETKSAATATLLDPDGKVGKLYGAQTTPHMYVIDSEGILIYQGAIDSIKSTDAEDIPLSQNYVRAALDEAFSGNAVTEASTKAYGCSVKY
jgi:peroxiredoxin